MALRCQEISRYVSHGSLKWLQERSLIVPIRHSRFAVEDTFKMSSSRHYVIWSQSNGDYCKSPWAFLKIRKIAGCTCGGIPGTFSPPLRVCDPDMHHGTCVTHVPSCMPGSLPRGFPWSRWRGKRYRHSQRMRKPQFYVTGKRPMLGAWSDSTLCPAVSQMEVQLSLPTVAKLSLKVTLPVTESLLWRRSNTGPSDRRSVGQIPMKRIPVIAYVPNLIHYVTRQ